MVKNAAEQVLKLKYTSIYKTSDAQDKLERSHYFMMSNDEAFLKQTPMVPRFKAVPDSEGGEIHGDAIEQDWQGIPLWTDHYSTIFNILWPE